MTAIQSQLQELFAQALERAFGAEGRVDPLVRPSGDEKFGDYQSNVAMGLAKKLGSKPRDVAQKLVDALAADERVQVLCEPFEIAGPGFINIRLRTDWLARQVESIPLAGAVDRLGIEPAGAPKTVVVDYSSPNIAKQMHVGHIRSTIIGDAIARVLEFQGHRVIRQNHIGDWGTQFGMVILGLWHHAMAQQRGDADFVPRTLAALTEAGKDEGRQRAILAPIVAQHQAAFDADPNGASVFQPFLARLVSEQLLSLAQIEQLYRFVNSLESAAEGKGFVIRDPRDGSEWPYERLSRRVTTYLQQLHEQEKAAWEYTKQVTLRTCNEMYRRLGVSLTDADVRGESFYEDRLAGVVESLVKDFGESGAAAGTRRCSGPVTPECPNIAVRDSDGALCVFHTDAAGGPVFKNADGGAFPMIIRKSDGAFLYATTDLAAVRFRTQELHADRIVYVTDARQALHFQMLFATVRASGWAPPEVELDHVTFGSILGEDRRPLKTRTGENISLAELLDEAVARSEAVMRANEADPDKKRGFTEAEITSIATAVGIGAVKYADLSQNRQSDYVFSWDKMLALEGNTAPYLMYAYARVRSIYRKGEPDESTLSSVAIRLEEPAERVLARQILRFAETLQSVSSSLKLNLLTDYLYELAGCFMKFYESCPVLGAASPELRAARLRLADMTARTLRAGLGLLGITVLERM